MKRKHVVDPELTAIALSYGLYLSDEQYSIVYGEPSPEKDKMVAELIAEEREKGCL